MGKAPHGLAMAPDGKRLLVTLYAEDRIGVWETASAREVNSIAVAKPHTRLHLLGAPVHDGQGGGERALMVWWSLRL